jgi:MSV199 domain/Protein of unknown function (DUF3627)
METKTVFMGVDCDGAIQSGTIARALVASPDRKLNVQEYVDSSGFNIDGLMFNEFWQVIAKRRRSHMGPSLLEWLGYEGDGKTQKRKFKEFLDRNNISYEQLSSSDDRINEYSTITDEMKEMRPVEISKAKWLIMNSRDFKKAIMKLSTKRGDAIREYYLNVEELLQEYVEYDKRFELRKRDEDAKREILSRDIEINKRGDKIDELLREVREQNRKLDDLHDINIDQSRQLNTLTTQNNDLQQDVTAIGLRLGAACVDRAPRPINPIKRERFVFIRWTNLNYHRTIRDPTQADNHRVYRYYAIRGQTQYSNSALRAQRQKDPALEVILELDVQPNTKTLYNRVKEELEERGVRYIGNALSITNSDVDEVELVERLGEINDDKFNVQ